MMALQTAKTDSDNESLNDCIDDQAGRPRYLPDIHAGQTDQVVGPVSACPILNIQHVQNMS
jgi:hypothetical protein